ncbi:hypothetical protein M0R45_024782 [Rubus argutus]|uniref:Myb-related protein 123 n=1 Tax=Rubus argutus TaxID=59490 RepID=A0AAW1WU65_RUBAR
MAPKNDGSTKRVMNKGAWTAEEDRRLSEYIEIHGAKRWKTVASIAGLNRCGKSCRLRWLNYLRPNIKRGNISDDEEDLILRLHKLLGNRWSLIAGRLPGRTDNEIKNYWNSHLSKKIKQKKEKSTLAATPQETSTTSTTTTTPPSSQKAALNDGNSALADKDEEERVKLGTSSDGNFDVNEFFDFSTEGSYGLEWVNKFSSLMKTPWLLLTEKARPKESRSQHKSQCPRNG